jgi:hypothetical protein
MRQVKRLDKQDKKAIFLPKKISKTKGGGAMVMEEMAWGVKQGRRGLYRERVTIRLPFMAVRELEERARERGLSLSDLMRLYIEKCLKEEKQTQSWKR